jgi:hypothetical protein
MRAPSISAGYDELQMRTFFINAMALALMSLPAFPTTIVIIWNSREIAVAADSAGGGSSRSNDYCKIRRSGDVFTVVEGIANMNFSEPSVHFDAMAFAEKAAKTPGSLTLKALAFERTSVPVFENAAELMKGRNFQVYSHWILHPKPALQVGFIGTTSDKAPAYVIVAFDVTEDGKGRPLLVPTHLAVQARAVSLLAFSEKAQRPLSCQTALDFLAPTFPMLPAI